MDMIAPVLIFGYGNPSRGDDALGPELLSLLEARQSDHPEWPEIELLTDFQLQPEHALDLIGRSLVLFVDASAGVDEVALTRLRGNRDDSFTTHAMSPESLLHVFGAVEKVDAPPSYQLAMGGKCFELGDDLSPTARHNLLSAVNLIDILLANADSLAWDQLALSSLSASHGILN